jgi:serine/threonine-protein kinase
MTGNDGSAREPMSRDRWGRLEPLVDAALELPVAERGAYCDRIAATDPALGAELRRLIRRAEATHGLFTDAAVERLGLLFDDTGPGEPGATEPDLLGVLQAALGTAYTLEREIGGGGMSRVFVANEAGLGRKVVIKVLSPELAAGINADRFAREIRLAASLQQANIAPLLATGSAAGHPYYTMPLVEGRSLRDRLAREGALPIADAVSILRDVARALAFAHAHGVVHRDIKPGNVLLSGGTAVVTDFGIAKALKAASAGVDGPDGSAPALSAADGGDLPEITLTSTGSSLGTPAYMAPEQAAGDPASDHRADLYSFGCMAYEMFTGAPPFHGMPVHRVIAAHFNETPRPLGERRPDVPAAIATMVMRCLEKDPGRRPQTAAEVLDALDARVAPEGAAAPVGAKVGARWKLVGAVAIVLASVLTATAYRLRHTPPEPLTLAAIPFTNTAHDTALDYRSDGIRDEILTAMARVPGVQIIGRAAAYRFKNQVDGADVRTIAHDLGVRFLVTGTLRENNGQVTISVQLNDSTTRAEVWADTFVRDSKDFGSIADDIVRTITDTLQARFGNRVGERPRQASTVGTANSDALDFYLLGQDQLLRRRGVRQSVANFERAIALDPKFARAYASLATALQLYPYFVGTPPNDLKDTTIAIANRALGLDNTLAAPHVALGTAYAHAGRWAEALAEFKRGVDQDPGDVNARVTYGRYLVTIGRPTDAIAQLKEAKRVERVSSLASAWLAYAYFHRGQMDSARIEAERAIQDSTLLAAANVVSRIRLAEGRLDEARRVALVPPATVMTSAPYILAKTGDTEGAYRMLRQMESQMPRPWYVDAATATVQLAVGDSAGALTSLERSARSSGPVWLEYFLLSDPAYDLVRRSPRFIALVRQANLDPSKFVPASSMGRR